MCGGVHVIFDRTSGSWLFGWVFLSRKNVVDVDGQCRRTTLPNVFLYSSHEVTKMVVGYHYEQKLQI